jgi:hypothetical protein
MQNVVLTLSDPIFLCLYSIVGLVVLVLLFFSEIGGWPALAKEFPGRKPLEGTVLGGHVLAMGMSIEVTNTSMVVASGGLYLSSIILSRFRRAHAFVPWAQVRFVSERRLWVARWYKIDLGGVAFPTISEEAFRAIEPHLSVRNATSGANFG